MFFFFVFFSKENLILENIFIWFKVVINMKTLETWQNISKFSQLKKILLQRISIRFHSFIFHKSSPLKSFMRAWKCSEIKISAGY